MKKTFLTTLLLSWNLLLFAQLFPPINQLDTIKTTGDSVQYLSLQDTIFLEFSSYQEKIFNHYIAPKQTLYSISKFYGLSLEELYYYNPELRDQPVSIGQAINIPIPNKSIVRYQIPGFDQRKFVPVCYRIRKGDTMYNISKRTFKMPIDTVMARNNLTSFELSIGQVLQLGWMSIDGIPETNRKFRGHPIWKKNETMRRKYDNNKQVKKEYQQRGVAYWQKQTTAKGDEMFALHRNAPINSIIAVTNPMKKRTVYVRVIGRIPGSVYGDNVITVLSSAAAKMLGAKDARFYVKVRYTK